MQGVRGWLKVFSDTEPREQIFQYPQWWIEHRGGVSQIQPLEWKHSGKTLIVKLAGVDSREEAATWVGAKIGIPAGDMPSLESGQYYWFQLEGLQAWTRDAQGRELVLGQVDHLLETGANDVLVIRPTPESIDDRERLVPWSLQQTVVQVDLHAGRIELDWDAEF